MKNAIYIGRFQPFHNGHLHVIRSALNEGIDAINVLVGSANCARNIKNPFTYNERARMIFQAFGDDRRISVYPLDDNYNESLWLESVLERARLTKSEYILGSMKDSSSYYLDIFPSLSKEYIKPLQMNLNATDIRELYFQGQSQYLSSVLPEKTFDFIRQFEKTDAYTDLREEFKFIQKYKSQWAAAPYAPTFVTVDAVVVQSGHVLTVRRGANPGKGLRALPGGFINPNERIRDAAVRELVEETQINIPVFQLDRAIKAEHVFDDPNRSLRGRTITHAFLFKLDDARPLPRVLGSDDAASAEWIALSDLDPREFYEDHFHIIREMVRRG